jgi:hypothetical protein
VEQDELLRRAVEAFGRLGLPQTQLIYYSWKALQPATIFAGEDGGAWSAGVPPALTWGGGGFLTQKLV